MIDETELASLLPIDCQKAGAVGTPVVLGDGQEWLLADGGLCNALDSLRDKLDDDARLSGMVERGDVGEAAYALLTENYNLSPVEATALVVEADPKILTVGVMEALFGPESPRRTYTSWAASSLMANGIDPSAIPGHLRGQVLDQLVLTGRAVPLSKYVESAVAGREFARGKAIAEAQAKARADKAAAESLASVPEGGP